MKDLTLVSTSVLSALSLAAQTVPLPPERQELIPLPLGAITARGWAQTLLERNRDGLGGHFGEMDPDQFEKPFQTHDYDAKLIPGNKKEIPGWCAEMAGEYRLGQLELAETLGDETLRITCFPLAQP